MCGSPPRAWGQYIAASRIAPYLRFTPTGVGTISVTIAGGSSATVHPHGRGDNACCGVGDGDCVRFTPTGVGTIAAPPLRALYAAVHPHGRGDNTSPPLASHRNGGSPPRAWGQSAACAARLVKRRFTPTGVGTIGWRRAWRGRRCGSPPRAWGQWRACRHPDVLRRFTTTGVGTIVSPSITTSARAVHPHGRGDNSRCAARSVCPRGSPPRAWGQSGVGICAAPDDRFTPTGVGTIRGRYRRRSGTAVHPHGRGDNGRLRFIHVGMYGSPPRAWGQSVAWLPRAPACRFTPTGVGTILASQAF